MLKKYTDIYLNARPLMTNLLIGYGFIRGMDMSIRSYKDFLYAQDDIDKLYEIIKFIDRPLIGMFAGILAGYVWPLTYVCLVARELIFDDDKIHREYKKMKLTQIKEMLKIRKLEIARNPRDHTEDIEMEDD